MSNTFPDRGYLDLCQPIPLSPPSFYLWVITRFPPIVVYKVGDVYFVLDGNHRVSVARFLDAESIPAYVTEVETRIPLTPDVQPDELICQAQYASFLNETHLDDLRPQADLTVTAPGQYRVLKGQINRCWNWLRCEEGEDTPYEKAVTCWYDEIYFPLAEMIRRRSLLRYFPDRTETDLYAWIVQHQQEMADELGWQVDSTAVARDPVQRCSPNPRQVLARVKERLLDLVMPDTLETGPAPGRWRKEVLDLGRERQLFANILVPITGHDGPWCALEQALVVARREGGRVHGLHVITGELTRKSPK